jgi:serine/threonine protein kinase/predicted Zn-dependent protease
MMNNPLGEGDDRLRLSQLRRVDALCTDYSMNWAHGRLLVEHYLAGLYLEGITTQGERESLLRYLLAYELEQRRTLHERPAPEEYRQRFPLYSALIDELFLIGASDGGQTAALDMASRDEGNRFRILRHHASGGLGNVFVALDVELNREVALKEIQDQHADDPLSRARFLLEAEITGGLEHPGIVPVYSLGQYPDRRPYYAMRFIRGESLKDAISSFHADGTVEADLGKKSLQLRKLLRRFIDVCNAVRFAHSRHILHRDIKPDNIMIGRYGETLVVDWGLAKVLGEGEEATQLGERPLEPIAARELAGTLPGTAVGTPSYMSPEQAAGNHERLGPWSDVYSLGATLYSLLTGKPPFVGHDPVKLSRAVQEGRFPPPRQIDPTIDQSLEAVCLKAMARTPADRYATVEALSDDIEHWLGDEPVSAYRENRFQRTARWMRRHRTWVQAGSVALAIITIVSLTSAFYIRAAYDSVSKANVSLGEFRDTTIELLSKSPENLTTLINTLNTDQALLKYIVYPLLDRSESMSLDETNLWKARLPQMTKEQTVSLLTILGQERRQLRAIDDKYLNGTGVVSARGEKDAAQDERLEQLADQHCQYIKHKHTLNETDSNLTLILAEALLARGEARAQIKAADLLLPILESEPNNAHAHYLAAQLYLKNKVVDKAEGHLQIAVLLAPSVSEYAVTLASIKKQSGRPNDARKILDSQIGLTQNDARLYQVRGDLLSDLKDFSGAITDYTKSLDLEPNNYTTLVVRGNAYYQHGDWKKAIADYGSVIAQKPVSRAPELNLYRGRCYKMVGEFRHAVEDFMRAVTLEPKDPRGWMELASLLATSPDAQIRNGDLAVIYATRVCETSMERADHLDILASAYAESGDWARAIELENDSLLFATTEAEREEYFARLQLYERRVPYHAQISGGEQVRTKGKANLNQTMIQDKTRSIRQLRKQQATKYTTLFREIVGVAIADTSSERLNDQQRKRLAACIRADYESRGLRTNQVNIEQYAFEIFLVESDETIGSMQRLFVFNNVSNFNERQRLEIVRILLKSRTKNAVGNSAK